MNQTEETTTMVASESEGEILLTTAEVCELFNKTPMTIYLWRRDEELPVVTISGRAEKAPVRFRLTDLLRWAALKGKEVEESVLEKYSRGEVT